MRLGLAGIATFSLVVSIGTWLAGPSSDRSRSESEATPSAVSSHVTGSPVNSIALAEKIGQAQNVPNLMREMVGQIVNRDDQCLSKGGSQGVHGSPVILEPCNGDESGQEWTLLPDDEFVLNGRCLGVEPKAADFGGSVGLYVCSKTGSETWRVLNKRNIMNVSSGLCLSSSTGKSSESHVVQTIYCRNKSGDTSWILPSRSVDVSGFSMPYGDMPGWRQVFTDNFTENVPLGSFPEIVSNKWGDYLDGWKDTTHNGTYEPTNVVSIRNGIMNLFLHTVDGVHMVAAPYPKIPAATGPDGGSTYGVYEVRFKAQQVKGYKTAWLLWPDSNNQRQGEIDFPEGNLQQDIRAFMHHLGVDPKLQDAYFTPYTYANWHTATTIWTADSVIFMLDGKVIGDSKVESVIPHDPMHWVLQTETRTGGGPPSNAASANVKIDWVAVWYPKSS